MKQLLALFCLIASVTLAGGCSQPLEQGAYRAYIQDLEHGLTQDQNAGPTTVRCSYRPVDLLVAQELISQKSSSPQLIDSLRRSFAGKTYFSLSLAQNGTEIENQFVTNQTTFTQSITYLSNGIAQDVYLATPAPDADSVAALTALYPRQYGTTGHSTVLLLFDTRRLDLSRGFTLTYHDTQFQLGTVRFPFAAAYLDRLPALKF